MLQQMRSLAKYVWVLVALFFVGGFLLYETSGLMGRTPVTTTTAVAVVNGHEIMYRDYEARVQNEVQSEQQQAQGRSLSQDDNRRIENSVFDQMVTEVLLNDEYRQRGIVVTDDEIKEFARYAPPPWITNESSLQTDGQFDPQKYGRLLASPQARQSGLLIQLENYYRSEIPREKLFDQVSSGVYVSDAELWRAWRDQHDSAQVSYLAFTAASDSSAKSVSDEDARAYFDKHKSEFQGPGRATLSVVMIPRAVTAADTAAARARAEALRAEIVKGAKFEDVAKRESADSASGRNGGDLGKGGKGRFVPEFEKAAYALPVGEVSQPVLSPFGFHLIKVDSKKGDTLSLRHILITIQASDSASSRIDKQADSLSRAAAQSEQGAKLDSAAKRLHLQVLKVQAFENEPAMFNGRTIPSVSAWAFGGARPGETSDLFDDENGYYLARLDTIQGGGEPTFEAVEDQVKARVAADRALDKLIPEAQKFAAAAAASTLEAAAQQANKKVVQTAMFTRASMVPGLGQFNEAIGAAFALPTGAVSQPVRTSGGVYVERVDKRVLSDSAAWLAQKTAQKQSRLQQLRQQRVQMFLQDLRKSAKVNDRRKDINTALRRQQA
ncbi:MAG TPA: peptidyl-prolyl cis-trans isomerase [Gemmatimonadaceae bacterium]|nr:peptidyl-prolyl cis-trans isomerase [Gemmatimonadaceae bacterium]